MTSPYCNHILIRLLCGLSLAALSFIWIWYKPEKVQKMILPKCHVDKIEKTNVIELHINGNLKCVLDSYHQEIISHREHLLPLNVAIKDGKSEYKAYDYILCSNCNFTKILYRFNQVKTIKVLWKSLLDSNWTKADFPVAYHYRSIYPPKTVCIHSDITDECKYHLNSQLTLNKSNTIKKAVIPVTSKDLIDSVLFVHIIHGGQIDPSGNVRTENLDIVPDQCFEQHVHLRKSNVYVKEVFIISQNFGKGYYHSMAENMPRIAAYLDFLYRYPNISIHIATDFLYNYLHVLGIPSHRIIKGNVKAQIIYMPQTSGCGRPKPLQVQLLNKHYLDYVIKNLNPGPWNSVVQIFRSKKRYLEKKNEVADILQRYCKKYDFRYEKYPDNPPPGFNETAKIFARARIVVAPHGAGLANLLFSRQRTRIIEILPSKTLNPSYYRLSTYLGQVYSGLLNKRRNDDTHLDIDLPYFQLLLENTMKSIRLHDNYR